MQIEDIWDRIIQGRHPEGLEMFPEKAYLVSPPTCISGLVGLILPRHVTFHISQKGITLFISLFALSGSFGSGSRISPSLIFSDRSGNPNKSEHFIQCDEQIEKRGKPLDPNPCHTAQDTHWTPNKNGERKFASYATVRMWRCLRFARSKGNSELSCGFS
jgi:hypothetical protein